MTASSTAAMAAPIIAFANLRWDGLWMNRQHLLTRLAARGHAVAYSNGPAHYSEFGKGPLFQRGAMRDGVMVMNRGYVLPRMHRMSMLTRLAIRLHLRALRASLGIEATIPSIGMCFDPWMIDHVDMLRPTVSAFHIYDAYHRMDGSLANVVELRRRLQRFDLVTAASRQMYEEVMGVPAPPELIVPNGVDYDGMLAGLAAPSAVADAIMSLPEPRYGYIGSINTKVDFALVEALARAMPGASFVLVGPLRARPIQRSPTDHAAYQRMRQLPNVHLFGGVPHHEVAAIMQAMTVNCLFLRVDRADWVESVYPLKLHEYLAVGRPVASSAVKVVCEEFSTVIDVCRDQDQWVEGLRRAAVDADDPQAIAARRAIARENDWRERVAQFDELLGRTMRARLS